ncbi:hypothetical protein C2S52_005685 [Perilla frutescens var. hirtella]|nr:hypothetical protein C2S52_005685 [Perilla frutescens var. hirtella]
MALMLTYFFFAVGLYVSFSSLFCSGSDTISAGQSLFPNQTIISEEGKFELGFFAPGNNSSSYYVGIWYKNIPVRTVVWVLNRDTPIPYSLYNYSQLEISNATLLLRSGLQIFWEYTYNGKLNANEAVILDNGNFILRNASEILWQSFEHPTDTWLPGAKLGYSWLTDIEPKLVSWSNPDDPASGIFSLGMGPNGGSELSIRANSIVTWNSGPWRGGTFVSLSDNSEFKNSYNFTYLPRDGNVYVTYNVFNESALSRIVMDYMGRMMQFRWSEARQAWVVLMARPSSCSAYALCGPNTICNINHSKSCRCLSGFQPRVQREWDLSDFSNGCVMTRPLHCAEKVGFMKVATNRLPPYANSEYEDILNNVCQLSCMNNCSCNAYAYESQGGCILYKRDLLDLDSPPNNSVGVELYVKMRSKGKRKVPLVALVVPITAAIPEKSIKIYSFFIWIQKDQYIRNKHGMAWNMWIQERVVELVDPILEIPASCSDVPFRYIQIGLLCVQENPADRPLMCDVVAMLNNEDSEMTAPLNPAFTVVRTSAKTQKVEVEMCSVNGLTLSHVEAR